MSFSHMTQLTAAYIQNVAVTKKASRSIIKLTLLLKRLQAYSKVKTSVAKLKRIRKQKRRNK